MEKDNIKCECGHLESDHPKVNFEGSLKIRGGSIMPKMVKNIYCTKCEECSGFIESEN